MLNVNKVKLLSEHTSGVPLVIFYTLKNGMTCVEKKLYSPPSPHSPQAKKQILLILPNLFGSFVKKI